MIGREQALGPFPLKAKAYYLLFGFDHMGLQVRAMHLRGLLDNLREPSRILDAGCRAGVYCFYFARRCPSAQVLGIDVDKPWLQIAEYVRRRLGKRGSRIMFQEADLTTYRTDTPFDLICCIDVLEHITDDEVVLTNLRSALEKGGLLLLHVPQRVELNHYVLPGFPTSKMSEGHVREYTEIEIVSKVKRAGFEIQEIHYTFGLAGSFARELYYRLEEIRPPLLRAMVKGIMAAFLRVFAYIDSRTKNKVRHQGFFISARPVWTEEH